MAAPTTAAEYVVMRRPSLSGDARTPDLILFAEGKLSSDYFGDHYFEAVGLLTLHLVETSESDTDNNKAGGNQTNPGAITSESEGRLSKSYDLDKLTGYAAAWNSTSWGIELTALAASRQFGMRTSLM